jgi:hypothetical protein
MTNVTHGKTVATPDECRVFAAELVRTTGTKRAAETIGLSKHATLAVALGAPVMRGTIAIVREAMRQKAAERVRQRIGKRRIAR